MAVRSTILVVGDITAAGRPLSELTLINPALAATQTDFVTWNIQSQAWQQLTPGVNSNTSSPGSDLWSWESGLREALRSNIPTGTIYLIKHAGASDVADWAPQSGSFMSALSTQVSAAAAAAALAGDSIRIDAIVYSVQVLDHLQADWRTYGSTIRASIDKLRSLAGVTYGSLRGDVAMTPVVVVEPHYGYAVSNGHLEHLRVQLHAIESEEARIAVARTHGFTAAASGSFDAPSQLALAQKIAERFYAAAIVEGSVPRLLGLQLGDSTAEGSFTDNSGLLAHQQAALSGAQIWKPKTGSFATLQAGVNNLISWPQFAAFHGPEIVFCDLMRSVEPINLVKATQINSVAGDWRGQVGESAISGSPTPPFDDRAMVSWGSGAGSWLDAAISWTHSAIEVMREQNLKPMLGPVIISLGLNDCIRPAAAAGFTALAILKIRAAVLDLCRRLAVDVSRAKFLVAVPPAYAVNAGAPYNTISADDLNQVRSDIKDLPNRYSDIILEDLEDHAASDWIHPSTAGTGSWARAIFESYQSSTSSYVAPLFSPSMVSLRKALRLSKVSDDSDAISLIDHAVQTTKARFYARLGDERIEAIRAIGYTSTPKTSAEFLRIVAVDTEVKMVRLYLMRTMPMMFMDGGTVVQSWNEEAAFRETSYLQTRDEIRRLESEIETNLTSLAKAQFSSETGAVEAFPTTDNDLPGASVFVI